MAGAQLVRDVNMLPPAFVMSGFASAGRVLELLGERNPDIFVFGEHSRSGGNQPSSLILAFTTRTSVLVFGPFPCSLGFSCSSLPSSLPDIDHLPPLPHLGFLVLVCAMPACALRAASV